MMQIPSFEYDFDSKDIQFLQEEIANILTEKKFLNMGRWCQEFENQFKHYHRAPYALSTNSGTSALEILLAAHQLQGADILVPTNTFAATVIAILRIGARPVFVDCDKDLGLCPEDTVRKLTSHTRAIVCVHIGGFISPQIERIQAFCQEHQLKLLEDAAHAHGSQFRGQFAGEFGDGAAFSFYSTKVMTTGEGGMLITKHQDIYERAKLLRHHGQAQDNLVTLEGHNFRMHEFQALMGICQIKKLSTFIQKRRRIAHLYDQSFERLQTHPDSFSNFYKYILPIPPGFEAKKIQHLLHEKFQINLGGYVYPIPCHLQPALKKYHQGDPLPMAESLCRSHFCLPISSSMTDEQAIYVVESLKSILESEKKYQFIPPGQSV